MLKNDVIYDSSFRFRDISLSNVNDIYFAINIAIITITLFETFIAIALVFKLVIIIVINVNIVIVVAIVPLFEKSVFKLIAFDLNMKDCFIMSASFDKS